MMLKANENCNIVIKGVGKYIPLKYKLDNDFFITHFRKQNMECSGLLKSQERKVRYYAGKEESSLSMGIEAAKEVIKKTNIPCRDIDMIIFCTNTPEYTSPTNALKVSEALKTKNAHRVFDINCNCTGFLVGIDNAVSIMKNDGNVKTTLVVGAEIFSTIVNYHDTVTFPTFGDSGAAIILQKEYGEETKGFIDVEYYTDTNYHNNIVFPKAGNSNVLMSKDKLPNKERRLMWEPFKYDFGSTYVKLSEKLFEKNNINADNIKYWCFSQFDPKSNKKALKLLGNKELNGYVYVGDKYGYTGNTSPLLALDEIYNNLGNDMEPPHEDYMMFASVAAGLSFIALLYKF